MGAHHAPVHVARHAAPTSPARVGRVAGRGVLTASAALALVGAGSGAALAHDEHDSSGLLSDNDTSLLCGLLGGDECSSDSDFSDSDAGSSDDADSLLDRVTDVGGSYSSSDSRDSSDAERSPRADRSADESSDRSDATPSSGVRQIAKAPSASSNSPAALDAPPPPGQVRTIDLPG